MDVFAINLEFLKEPVIVLYQLFIEFGDLKLSEGIFKPDNCILKFDESQTENNYRKFFSGNSH